MEWKTEYRASWLCLKEKGKHAVVVRLHPGAILSRGMARIFDGYINGKVIYIATDYYKPGQLIRSN